MKVLFFSPAPSNNNPTMCPFIMQRIAALQKLGVEIEVLQHGSLMVNSFPYTRGRGFFSILSAVKNGLKYLFIRFLPIACSRRFYSHNGVSYIYYDRIFVSSLRDFVKWFRKNKFDLIHGHFLGCGGFLPTLKQDFGIPYVITAHGSDVHDDPFRKLEKQQLYADILNKADHCIFVSDYLRKKSEEFGFKNKHYSVIYNGFDTDTFYLDEKKTNLTEKIDFPILGFVGHTIYVKRIDILPDVLKIVQKTYPSAKLYIVGFEDGPDDLTCFVKKRCKAFGIENNVIWTGKVLPEKVAEYMKTFDVLLFPSRNEGFGCVCLEAQSCGVGVVASANGGIPEAVKSGICVPDTENFINDYAAAIVRWLNSAHTREEIAKSVQDFTWANCAKKEYEVYRNVIYIYTGGGNRSS